MTIKGKARAGDFVSAAMVMGAGSQAGAMGRGRYTMECFGPDKLRKWRAESKNLVVNVGLKNMNENHFTAVAYTAAWFVGMYGSAGTNNPAAGDTAALHPGWVEVTPYSNPTRVPAVFTAATDANPSIITNASAPSIFNINATAVVGGAFLISDGTKGGVAGNLFSAADLQAPGDRNVALGDIVVVTYRFELTGL